MTNRCKQYIHDLWIRFVGDYLKDEIITFDGLKAREEGSLILKMCPGRVFTKSEQPYSVEK